jgi:hypothetical protein
MLVASVGFAESIPPEKLIAQLRSTDWGERQEAEDALVEIGTPAAAIIQAALDKGPDSPEVRERLVAALARIEREGLLVATPVTVDQIFATPREAFEFLAKQVNLSLEPENEIAAERAEATEPVIIKLKAVPWLEAIGQVRDMTAIDYRIVETQLILAETPPPVVSTPQTLAGAIMLTPESIRLRRSLDLSQQIASSSVSLRLVITTEPKVQFSGGTARLLIRSAVDADGNNIGGQDVNIALSRERSSQMVANIALGKGKPDQVLKTLVGELHGDLITRNNDVRVSLASDLPRAVVMPDAEFEITSIERDPRKKNWEMLLSVSQQARNAASINMLLNGSANAIRVTDDKGRPMKLGRGVQKPQTGFNLEIAIPITGTDDEAKPTDLVWTIAAQTRGVRIPFELHDLPMPD